MSAWRVCIHQCRLSLLPHLCFFCLSIFFFSSLFHYCCHCCCGCLLFLFIHLLDDKTTIFLLKLVLVGAIIIFFLLSFSSSCFSFFYYYICVCNLVCWVVSIVGTKKKTLLVSVVSLKWGTNEAENIESPKEKWLNAKIYLTDKTNSSALQTKNKENHKHITTSMLFLFFLYIFFFRIQLFSMGSIPENMSH